MFVRPPNDNDIPLVIEPCQEYLEQISTTNPAKQAGEMIPRRLQRSLKQITTIIQDVVPGGQPTMMTRFQHDDDGAASELSTCYCESSSCFIE